MTDLLEGEYEPSAQQWVRDQVAAYEASGGKEANTLADRGIPIVVITMHGAKSGKIRKIALMRVEHEGAYAAVASMGGAPKHPVWYHNLVADPVVQLQDGPEPHLYRARLLTDPAEYAEWWERAVSVYPDYADYAKKTEGIRQIPVFVLERI